MATNPLIKFLFGQKLKDKTVTFEPGVMYLDTYTKEMWYDDPSNTLQQHSKIIDTNTLVYSIEETFEFPGEVTDASGTSAVLGVAVLGSMVLGSP